MAGTACMFNDYADRTELYRTGSRNRNYHLLSSWLFGKVNTGCLLVDISTDGGAALIPQKQNVPAQVFDLLIMSADNKDEVISIIQAEKRWINPDYSESHKKIGFRFTHIEQIKPDDISSISQQLQSSTERSLLCSLLNR